MTPEKNIPLLMNASYYAFNRALPGGDLAPTYYEGKWTTHCNQAMQYVCNALGYSDFTGMTANEMISFMKKANSGWIQPANAQIAQEHANNGVIVLAGLANEDGHGHVCLVVPGVLEKSGSWCKSVPKCMNVGKDVFFGKKISFAFSAEDECEYFALAKMI